MPELIDFQNEHRGDDRFAILSFHGPSVRDFEQYDEVIADIKETRWEGRDLPFPVLLDKTGKTFGSLYEIHRFPTTLLFDPQGRLVGHGNVELLEKALRGEVKTPSAR